MDQINIITEFSDKNFHLLRVSLFSFIQSNPWFKGKLYLVVHKNFSFSESNLTLIQSIYSNTELLNCSSFLMNNNNRINMTADSLALIKENFSYLQDSNLLYFSNYCVFMKDISFLSFVELGIGSHLYSSICKNDILPESTHLINDFLTFSSSFKDGNFSKEKNKLAHFSIVIFDTFASTVNSFTKINQIWLQYNQKSAQFLKNPSKFNYTINSSSNIKQETHLQKTSIQRIKRARPKVGTPTKKVPNFKNIDRNYDFKKVINTQVDVLYEKENASPKLTVAMPIYNSKEVAWVAFEGLATQQNIDFEWELIVYEEKHHGSVCPDLIHSYAKIFQALNCSRIVFLSTDERISLVDKWIEIAKRTKDSSVVFLLHAADCHSPKNRLKITYDKICIDGYDWYDQTKGYFYSFISNRVVLYNYKGLTNLNMGMKTALIKTLPKTNLKRGIDGYIYKHFQKIQEGRRLPLKHFYDYSLYLDSIDTHGLNNISVDRETYFTSKPEIFTITEMKADDLKIDIKTKDRLKKLHKQFYGKAS